MKKFYPVNIPRVTQNDIKSVTGVMKKSWISSDGPEVKLFEEKFSKCPVPAGPTVPSGLHPFNALEPFPTAFAVCNPDPFFPQYRLQHLQPF